MADLRPVVLLYAPPWFGPARFSKHHLASFLAESGRQVLYLEAPLGPLSAGRRPWEFATQFRHVLQAPRQVRPGLWVRRYFNPVPYHSAANFFDRRSANRMGQRLLAPILRRDLSRLGLTGAVFIAGLPHVVDLLPLVPHRGLIYHCADDYAHVRGFPSSLPALEAELCAQANLVVVTAETLREPRLRFNPNTVWIPNGADLDHFQAAALPADDVAGVGQPVIGFVGALAQWVDIPLLAQVARSRPGWLLVLVGPHSTNLSALRELPNVRLMGPRPYAEVPRYLAAMDVALIPFVDDEVTRKADPIKAYEYLASGVPVVATDIPALRRLQPAIRVAKNRNDFLCQIEAALAAGRESGRVERQAEAAKHSWGRRFREFDQLVQDYVPA